MTPQLINREDGLVLAGDGMEVRADFTLMLPRLSASNLNKEMLVRAARGRNPSAPGLAIDATAGLGEDSLLLAAAGYRVRMFEYNPMIFALLEDALNRASNDNVLSDIVSRMELVESDSIISLPGMTEDIDIILLDPMFPRRTKSGLIKKKFQLLQQIEMPCENEEALFDAAVKASPKKIIVKRPSKGPYLCGRIPSYSISGSVIRYDVIVQGKP